jgi:RimJ/RimL family protein N-acetyltransferase
MPRASPILRPVTDAVALHRLRLRTPRLTLRLGARAELEALAAVAAGGIHPADEMPFAVPWTDAADEPGFVDEFVQFHEAALETWTPDAWTLNLLAFAAGGPVGVQSISATAFAAERSVDTGSWLGAASQGRGLGTEMRAAVLELAFAALGARVARSGWLESGAGRSATVSRRLGYSEIGTHLEHPRGVPVVHHDLVLDQADWTCPVAVELVGIDACLPLFGVTSP